MSVKRHFFVRTRITFLLIVETAAKNRERDHTKTVPKILGRKQAGRLLLVLKKRSS